MSDDSVRVCQNCDHNKPHNNWGRCSEDGCDCRSYDPGNATVVVLRNPETLRPVAIPDEIISAADRVYRAYEMHRKGMSWATIAAVEQWPSASAVATEVRSYLDEGRAIWRGLKGQEMIAVAYDRATALLNAAWDAAMAGKVQHIAIARQLNRDLIEIAAMAKDPDGEQHEDGTPKTLVVGSDSYADDLRRAAGGQ